MPLTASNPDRPQDEMPGLLRLELRHVPAAAEQLARAFADDPLWTAVFPDPGERTRRLRPFFAFGLRYGIMAGEAWAPSERLEGAAVWLSSGRLQYHGIAALRAGMLAIPFQVGLSRLRRLSFLDRTVSRVRREDAPPEYRYLAMLGIGPEYQKQGLGAVLLRTMLDRCDRDGLPVWLETETEANVEFYLKYGFKVITEFTVPVLAVGMWGMLRPPLPLDKQDVPC